MENSPIHTGSLPKWSTMVAGPGFHQLSRAPSRLHTYESGYQASGALWNRHWQKQESDASSMIWDSGIPNGTLTTVSKSRPIPKLLNCAKDVPQATQNVVLFINRKNSIWSVYRFVQFLKFLDGICFLLHITVLYFENIASWDMNRA